MKCVATSIHITVRCTPDVEGPKRPNKINWDMSGWVAVGGFVTDRYLQELSDKTIDKNGNEVEWAKRLYAKVEARTHWTYKATSDKDYNQTHVLPDYGKVYGKVSDAYFEDETGTDANTALGVWFKGKAIIAGSELRPNITPLTNPKAGNLLRVHSSLTVERRMLELKYEIGAPLREAIEKATEAMDQFRIQFLDPFIISTPADRNSYRIKVNYRTK